MAPRLPDCIPICHPFATLEMDQHVVDAFCRPSLHPIRRVAADVQGDAHARMAGADLCDLRMYAMGDDPIDEEDCVRLVNALDADTRAIVAASSANV